MPRRLATALYFALGATCMLAPGAAAQQIVMIAFGDSITEGYGDTSSLGGGYTKRLDHWLDQQGYSTLVRNHGVGGETTSQGLSRVDSVLAEGGDYFLLMEGTNDISHRTGIESIRFNLNEMASRAEALGMIAVHATVIPRIPTAPVDSSNVATGALAAAIRSLGLETNRAVVDNFAVFEGLPDVFNNYYYYVEGVNDPVGHPNTDGYIEIAGTFLEALLPLLAAPSIRILGPSDPLDTGALVGFGVNSESTFVRVEWEFGDGGFAVTAPPGALSALYFYLHAGTYVVQARGFTSDGAVVQDTFTVVVAGPEPAWSTRTALLPVAVESNDGLVVSDLLLANSGIFFGIAEVTLLAEIRTDTPPPVRRFLVPAQGATTIPELFATAFGVGTARGALKVEFYVIPNGSAADFASQVLVHSPADPDGVVGALVGEIAAASWNSGERQILEIPHSAAAPATIVLANLDATAGSVRLDLYDAVNGFIGSGVLDLAAGAARLRSLSDLFRGLDQRPAPFRAVLSASGVRYSAAALIADPATGAVTVLDSTP